MSEQTAPDRHPILKRLPLIVIVIVSLIGLFTLRDYLSFDALAQNRGTPTAHRDSVAQNRDALLAYRDANYALSALVFVAVYMGIVGFSLPGATIATLTGGFLFGTFPGVLFNVTAATLGATAVYMAARWGFGDRLADKMEHSDGAIKRIKDGIDENQWSVLFIMRLVPAVPFFIANLIPAMVGVPLHRFVISTFFGIIPGGLVFTSVGAGLGEVFASGAAPDLGVIFEPQVLLPILGLAALSALPMILKLMKKGA